MAVVRVTVPYHFVGLAADERPTNGVPAGSRFFEVDTGLEHIFDGDETWYPRIFPATLPE